MVLTVIDAEGYLWDYKNKCTDCGIKQLSAQLSEELGIAPDGIVIAATHTHSGPEFLGGWGFVPDWYMTQVKESIKQSVTEAVTTMEPAALETGEILARPYNHERRDTYRSAEEQELTYLRALALNGNSGAPHPTQPETIATVGAYAAHPVTFGTNNGIGVLRLGRRVRAHPRGSFRGSRPPLHDGSRKHVGESWPRDRRTTGSARAAGRRRAQAQQHRRQGRPHDVGSSRQRTFRSRRSASPGSSIASSSRHRLRSERARARTRHLARRLPRYRSNFRRRQRGSAISSH